MSSENINDVMLLIEEAASKLNEANELNLKKSYSNVNITEELQALLNFDLEIQESENWQSSNCSF